MFHWNPLESIIIPMEQEQLSHRDQIRWSRWYIHLRHHKNAHNLADMILFKQLYGVVYDDAQEKIISRVTQFIPLEVTSDPTWLERKEQSLQTHHLSKTPHLGKQCSRNRPTPSVK